MRHDTRRRGRQDQRARAALAPLVAAGLAYCWRCRQPIRPGEAWDAGHVADLATGGDPAGRVLPEHSRCNRSAGGKLGAQLRRGRRPRRRPAAWARFVPRPAQRNTPRLSRFPPGPQGIATRSGQIA